MDDHGLENIDKYLDGLMSTKEQQAFEKRLATNESMQKQLNFAQFERKVMATNSHEQKLAKIKAWDQIYLQKKRRKRSLIFGVIIFLLMLAGVLAYHFSKNPSLPPRQHQIVALYVTPESLIDKIDRTGEQTIDTNPLTISQKYIQAHQLFLNKQYKTANELFKELSNDVTYGVEAEWFAVLSYYAYNTNDNTNETPVLRSILADEIHPYFDEAQKLQKIIQQRSE